MSTKESAIGGRPAGITRYGAPQELPWHKPPQMHFNLLNHYTCPIPVLGGHFKITFSRLANKTVKNFLYHTVVMEIRSK